MDNLISIIVPVYNVEKYLDRCIKSIINQTYKNLEIILIDDGSTDSSGGICDKWAQKDDRIKVIHKENGGVSSARNVGLNIANGEYIGFVDSDDYIEPKMYEDMINIMKKDNTQLCFCDYFYDENEKKISTSFDYSEIMSNKELMQKMFDKNNANCAPWNKLYLTEIAKKIKFDDNITIKEDALYIFQYLNEIKQVSYLNSNLYHYVMQPESTLHVGNIDKKITSLEAIIKIIEILKENKIDEYLKMECIFIGSFYKYKNELSKTKREIDLKKYDIIIKEYTKNVLKCRKVVFRDKLKVILAVYFNTIYNFLLRS